MRIAPLSPAPEVSVLICTRERPYHLQRCLESVASQTAIDALEIIVSDDGSQDHTQAVVRSFAQRGICPVYFVTQPHEGFRAARVRNNAVAVSSAAYLLFIDGDCVIPRDHGACHLDNRERNVAILNDHVRMSAAESEKITVDSARQGDLWQYVEQAEKHRVRKKIVKDRFYSLLRLPMRPRLVSSNFSLWRTDFEKINGFDEKYVGWGLEDVDLQRRLSLLGIRYKTILHKSNAFHLWHPVDSSFRRKAEGTANRAYFDQGVKGPACGLGLKRTLRGDFMVIPMTEDAAPATSGLRIAA